MSGIRLESGDAVLLDRSRAALSWVRLVAVGSTNPVKQAAVRAIMEQLCPGAEIKSIEVDSGVSAQPLSDEEMVIGAKARAVAARNALDADLGIGMEGGVHRSTWGALLSSWAAIVDRQDRLGLGSGGRILLPKVLVESLEQGEELGPAMDRLSGLTDTRKGPGAVGILTNGLVVRDDAFRVAITCALAPFLHPAWYPD